MSLAQRFLSITKITSSTNHKCFKVPSNTIGSLPACLLETGVIFPIPPVGCTTLNCLPLLSIGRSAEGCIHDLKMTLEEVRRVFHGVYFSRFLIVMIWLGMQGIGDGLVTNSKSLDGINATTTSASERPTELLATIPTTPPAYNNTLGTKLYFNNSLLCLNFFHIVVNFELVTSTTTDITVNY